MNELKVKPGPLRNNPSPIRLTHCALSAGGIGGGLERMETVLYRYLDRSVFDPVTLVMNERIPGEVSYDPSIPYHYTGLEDRFERLLEVFSDSDIVVFNGGFDPLVCEAAKTSGAPCLVEIMHNTEPGQAYDNIDLTICVSETVREVQPDKARTAVIYNGVETDEFTFDPTLKSRDEIIILESGRRDKPVSFHLDELAGGLLPLDPGIELWLAGRGQTGASTDRVKYLGLIREIERVYARADIIVMLSKKEALGLCAIEAMACGCIPIVAADTGMKEVVTDGVNGYTVDAGNRESVLAVINEAVACHGSDKWRKMMASARETVEKRFDIHRCVREYEKAYLDVLNRKGRRKGRGPVGLEPPPDVDIADAFFFQALDRENKMVEAVRKMAQRKKGIKHGRVAGMAKTLTRFFYSNQRAGLVDTLFSTLRRSGYNDAEMVMLQADMKCKTGRINEALAILEEGVRQNPGVSELREVLETLKTKLG